MKAALIVSCGYFPIWSHSDSIGCTEPTGKNRKFISGRRNFQDTSMMPAQALKPGSTRPHWAAHTEVEISLGIGLEIETESMKALGGIPVIVKIL